jgi:hypothetical protein
MGEEVELWAGALLSGDSTGHQQQLVQQQQHQIVQWQQRQLEAQQTQMHDMHQLLLLELQQRAVETSTSKQQQRPSHYGSGHHEMRQGHAGNKEHQESGGRGWRYFADSTLGSTGEVRDETVEGTSRTATDESNSSNAGDQVDEDEV